ncbi:MULTISPECIES: VOC family protein [unclassified Phyllobacterium]|uniref:VOC family protein n=1 Tax=Phyllobacterium TaxID=28100 RepID=UPI000DD85204|nr:MULTISPECIES: VOC family protein [unclassified Phyllobacterium]MBA8899876.1 PhnB protein [Phyllobacterium sp. P30BS-XVII]UGX85850.1 VOC family protein [Phyllobacterium sp. T1293]
MAFGPNFPPLEPHICVKGGLEAIAFYEKAFGAENTFTQLAEDGKRVMHANIHLFGGSFMLHDEFPEYKNQGGENDVMSPLTRGGASVALNVNLSKPADVDAAVDRAVKAGATLIMPVQDTFWNARYGRIRDPFGHVWAFNAALEAAGE